MPKPSAEGDGYFRTIVDTLPAPVCRWLPDTTLTYANLAYERLIAGRSDVVGCRWLDFVPEGRRPGVEAFYRDWVHDPGTVGFEHEVRGGDGLTRWYSWVDSPLDDEADEFQSIGLDITPRKEAERERARIDSRLRESHKMEAVGRLAGGIAHDFNNMLGVVLGRVELALESEEGGGGLRADLLEIRRAAHRSADLTRQLLAFARKQPIAPEVIDLDEVVAGLLRTLRGLAGEDIALEWRPGGPQRRVSMDPTQIDQVLVGLVAHARAAIREGSSASAPPPGPRGTITLGTRTATVGEPASTDPAQVRLFPDDPPVEEEPPGRYVVLRVEDDGAGIDPARLPFLFEPFGSARPGYGMGLGLATVYGIVRQNEGFLRVHAGRHRGTTFEIYLPVHDGDAGGEAAARTRAERTSVDRPPSGRPPTGPPPTGRTPTGRTPTHRPPTVLIVEDEKPVLLVVQRVLERLDLEVVTADGPDEALEIARDTGRPIDLLLTDVVMPGMSGPEVFDHLRAERPQLRCLFMSGYPAEEMARNDLDDGAARFIQKPFSLERLEEEVQASLQRRG